MRCDQDSFARHSNERHNELQFCQLSFYRCANEPIFNYSYFVNCVRAELRLSLDLIAAVA